MAGNTFISKDLSKRGRLTLKGIILLFIILASFSFQETLAEGTTETY
ncbi:MAG: hypothetical protein GX175_04535 [Halanaerobiaceae bacterium]|nr:hypothetical protein [Halanaerobiaceae bacterium]